jgi:phage-related protein
MGGLKAGDLYVAVSANVQGYSKGMAQVLKDTEKATKQIAKVANEAARLAQPFALAAAGAVVAAATTNRAVERLTSQSADLFRTLGSEMGSALAPALKEGNEALAKFTAFIQSMSPEMKKQISDWAVLGLKIAVGAIAVAKITDGLHAVAEAAKVAGEAISAAFKMETFIPALAATVGILGTIGAIKNALPSSAGSGHGGTDPKIAKIAEQERQRRADNPTLVEMLNDKLKAMFFSPSAGQSNAGVLADSVKTGAETVFGPLTDAIKPLIEQFDALAAKFKSTNPNSAKIADKLVEPIVGLPEQVQSPYKAGLFRVEDSDVMKAFIERRHKIEQDYLDGIQQAISGLVSKFTSRGGATMELINSATEGAKAGGTSGAIAAVLVDLLSRSKQFQSIVGYLDGIVQAVADAFGSLLEPLMPLIAVAGELVKGIAPLVGVISALLVPVLQLLFEPLKFLGEVVLTVADAIAHAANFIAGIFGGKVNTAPIDEALATLVHLTWDQATALVTANKAANDFSESLTNVPDGFKVALGRFNAQDPSDPATSAPSSVSSGLSGKGGSVVDSHYGITINVNGITDPDAVADRVAQVLSDKIGRSTGRGQATLAASRFAQEY